MNKILFIRHGEPDYDNYLTPLNKACICIQNNTTGLTAKGIKECEQICDEVIKFNPDLIITSPYTRAIQSAHIISLRTLIPLVVEKSLIEWLSNCSISTNGRAEYEKLLEEVNRNNGQYSDNCSYKWESFNELKSRAISVIVSYSKKHERIAVVSHKMLIYQLTGCSLPFCGFIQTTLENINSCVRTI